MNVGDSCEATSCMVSSKYFTHNSGMDESLSEFQEKKKICSGPKPTGKKISKPRKAPKKPRGQKDIRTALKPKSTELEAYSKDFDKVCKRAGIDVDSEQLQLAIALSKSLQKESTSEESTSVAQKVTSQNRIKKIRTTLQEYGFKVPEIRNPTSKTRKLRKKYKLIQTSEAEKKEIIANRYSHVLFQNISHCSLNNADLDTKFFPLYYLSSNVPYDVLRIRDTFYVDGLIDQSGNNTGNLLRDWCNIPGRPESPKLFEPLEMNFSEIECSQDELNIILSGPLKSCKDIMSKKIKQWNGNELDLVRKRTDEEITEKEINSNDQDVEIVNNTTQKNRDRSCSPDMFDDDSDIFENSKNLTCQKDHPKPHEISHCEVVDLTEPICLKSPTKFPINENVTIRKSNDMELTNGIKIQLNNECILVDETIEEENDTQENNKTKRKSNDIEVFKCKIQSDNGYEIVDETLSQLSQKSNATNRKSNDYMELTECVARSSQFQNSSNLIESPKNFEGINSTDSTINEKLKNSRCLKSKPNNKLKDSEHIDNENKNTSITADPEKDIESMDLTQSSNTSDELPYVCLTGKNKSLEDTIIIDVNDYAYINNNQINTQAEEVYIDLTQNFQREHDSRKKSQSFFDEYDHEHSSSTENAKENSPNINKEILDRIDLTQNIEEVNCKNTEESRDILENNIAQINHGQNNSQIILESVPLELIPSPIKNFNEANHTLSQKENQDIDLTHNSGTSEELSQTPKNDYAITKNVELDIAKDNNEPILNNSQRNSQLGKKSDVSIDYNNDIVSRNNLEQNFYENPEEDMVNEKGNSKNNSFLSNCSQNSEVFEISDKELDYSLHKSKLEIANDNFAFGGISVMDQLSNLESFKKSIEPCNNKNSIVNIDDMQDFLINRNSKKVNEISPIKHRRITEIGTPQKSSNMITVVTPKNSEMILKTYDVTPMANYDVMSTPDLHKELDKFGIKPFKRKRAIQLLTYIYNQTHPIIETDEFASPPKRHKPNQEITRKHLSPRKLLTSPEKDLTTDKRNDENNLQNNHNWKGKGKGKKSRDNQNKSVLNSVDNMQIQGREIFTNEVSIKEIACSSEDWVFTKREKAKVHTCRLPLHIAFHNYVFSNRVLREAILCYEPVEIDRIHKDLVGHGHRYDPKDLLKFLDKKCITVKTTDNDARNNKR